MIVMEKQVKCECPNCNKEVWINMNFSIDGKVILLGAPIEETEE